MQPSPSNIICCPFASQSGADKTVVNKEGKLASELHPTHTY